MRGNALRWLFAAVFCTAAFFVADGLWIPAKARLAQVLIERAWQQERGNPGATARPWPWADTTPAGVLEVPRLGIRQIVLAGASGRNLAFGPAAVTSIEHSDLIISGHRDTHFRFLGDLRKGERIRVETPLGQREFRVSGSEVVDSRRVELTLDPGTNRLTLLTCYPLDALTAGGPLRLVVTAEGVDGGGPER